MTRHWSTIEYERLSHALDRSLWSYFKFEEPERRPSPDLPYDVAIDVALMIYDLTPAERIRWVEGVAESMRLDITGEEAVLHYCLTRADDRPGGG